MNWGRIKLNRAGFIEYGEGITQRVPEEEWKRILLLNEDRIIYAGNVRELSCKKMGYGVVEIFMKPKENDK